MWIENYIYKDKKKHQVFMTYISCAPPTFFFFSIEKIKSAGGHFISAAAAVVAASYICASSCREDFRVLS